MTPTPPPHNPDPSTSSPSGPPPPVTPPSAPPVNPPSAATQRSVRSQISDTSKTKTTHHEPAHTEPASAVSAANANANANANRWEQALDKIAELAGDGREPTAQELEDILSEAREDVFAAQDADRAEELLEHVRAANDEEPATPSTLTADPALPEEEIQRRASFIQANDYLRELLSTPAPQLTDADGRVRTVEELIRANKTGEEYFADEMNIDGALQGLRWDNDMDGLLFSQFVYWFYPKPGEPLKRTDNTVYFIKDKGFFLTPAAFQKAVIDQQTQRAAEDAEKIYDDDLIPPPQQDTAISTETLISAVQAVANGDDLMDAGNAVLSQGKYQLARKDHNIGVIATYKGGKSTLMDHLIMCMTTDSQFFGEIDATAVPDYVPADDPSAEPVPGKILLVDPERGTDMMVEIPRAYIEHADDPALLQDALGKLVIYDALTHPLDITNRADQQTLIQFIKDHQVTRVVLDSCMYLAGKTDNISDIEVDALFTAWNRVRRETGVHETWWVVHTSHGDRTRAYGSQRWMARLQSMWLLERDEQSDRFFFQVLNGRAGTKYPRRQWVLDKETRVPAFVDSLYDAERDAEAAVDEARKKVDKISSKSRKTKDDEKAVEEMSSGKLNACLAVAVDGLLRACFEREVTVDGELAFGGFQPADCVEIVTGAIRATQRESNPIRKSFFAVTDEECGFITDKAFNATVPGTTSSLFSFDRTATKWYLTPEGAAHASLTLGLGTDPGE